MNRFVAREAEMTELLRLLETERLVTLWGAGGMGKSRLADEVARRASRRAHMVVLGQVSTAEGLCSAIASAASDAPMSARTGVELARQTGRRLRTLGRLLLVLDGFEHLVGIGVEVLTTLIEEAPELSLLVTSRERLRLSGEATLELGPLDAADAATLFAERSAGAGSLDLSDAHAQELLRRLEGIPLAIELAAARIEKDGSRAIAAGLPLATMRGAVAWSWSLLSPQEQAALSGCSVFRGSFSVAAIEQVLDTQPALERGSLLRSLRDKSLVYVRDDSGASARFALYDTVRDLAFDKLCEDDARRASLVERHDAWFSQRARELAMRIERSGDIHAREALARELDNLLEVHERALERWSDSAEARQRAIETLLAADAVLGTRSSARARLARWEATSAKLGVATVEPRLESRVRARLGQALAALGELDQAQREIERALELTEAAGDREAKDECLLDLGLVMHAKRSYAAARAAYMSALGDARAGDRRTMARVAGNLGALHHDEQRNDAAKRSYERSVELAAAAGDARIEGIMYANLALLEQEANALERSLTLFGRALLLLSQAKDTRLYAITQSNRGMLYLELERFEDALADHEAALVSLRHVAEARSEALACVRLAASLALLGSPVRAGALVDEAADAFTRAEDDDGAGVARLGAALVDVARSRPEAARRVLQDVKPAGGETTALSDDARTLLRILEQALRRIDAGEGEAEPEDTALIVAPDASAFRPPGGAWCDVAVNPQAQRVLAALAAAREADPHGGVEAPLLVSAGWPEASFDETQGRSRLYAVIAWLRDRGLDGILLRRPRGYFLDSDVPWARREPPEGLSSSGPATRRSPRSRRA